MRILFFGTYDVTTHPRVQVLQEGLRGLGHEVTECNVPLGLGTGDRVAMLRNPLLLPRLAVRILLRWAQLWWRARPLRRTGVDAVVVGYLGHFDVLLARRLFRRTTLVLDHLISASDTAVDRGERAVSRKVRLLASLDRAATSRADIVVVDTQEHVALVPQAARDRALVVAVGAPTEWFADWSPVAEDGGVRVIFFGLFTPLQGAPHIGRAIGLLADEARLRFTMCGSGQELDETRRAASANPRVDWLDWVAPEDLPRLVAAHDICLGILGTGPKALRVVPNKVFQGAAAGCAVVTSDTPPQRAALGRAAVYVPPGDAEALAAVLRGLAEEPAALTEARLRAHARARDAFVPVAVARPLHDRLERTPPA